MRMRNTTISIGAVVFGMMLAVSGCAKHNKSAQNSGPEITKATSSQSQAQKLSHEEMQKAWEQSAKPGDGHRALQPLVGKWDATVKSWYDPSRPPEVTKGTSETVWMLDGRFVQEKHRGKMMGKPFQGQGVLGFDNAQGKYVSSWVDTMTTGIFRQEGNFDPTNKTFTFFGAYKDPATGEIRKTRTVTRIATNDKHTFEMYELDDQGQEFKNLEITYTRKK